MDGIFHGPCSICEEKRFVINIETRNFSDKVKVAQILSGKRITRLCTSCLCQLVDSLDKDEIKDLIAQLGAMIYILATPTHIPCVKPLNKSRLK